MIGNSIQKRLAKNLKLLRKNKFTQETLAEAAGISWQMVTNIESCRRWPSQDTLSKLADALNVDVQQFFATEIPNTKKNYDIRNDIKRSVINELQQKLEEMKQN